MDTITSLQKENKRETLEKAKADLESANFRFKSEAGKEHPNDPTAKETFENKIKANEEEIKKIDDKLAKLKK